MLLAPFAGQLVDRVGRRATFMIVGSLILIPCHLAMGLTRIYPVYPMIALGFAFVLVPAALWPSVPLIVRNERVGTAFGLMTAIQNIGLASFRCSTACSGTRPGATSRARSCSPGSASSA